MSETPYLSMSNCRSLTELYRIRRPLSHRRVDGASYYGDGSTGRKASVRVARGARHFGTPATSVRTSSRPSVSFHLDLLHCFILLCPMFLPKFFLFPLISILGLVLDVYSLLGLPVMGKRTQNGSTLKLS
jgi:hypothetical protein